MDKMPCTLTPEQKAQFRDWISMRPPEIQEAFRQYPPGLYQNTGCTNYTQHVRLYSITEDAGDGKGLTCSFVVYQEDNPELVFIRERRVFGVPLTDLKPIDVVEWWED